MINNPAFLSLIGYALTTSLAHYAESGFTFAIPTIEIEPGDKFIRIVSASFHRNPDGTYADKASHHSCVAFVATRDFSNKTMGDVKAGDVFKSASYKAPARHARGNVLNDDCGTDCWGWHGPNYLKG